MKRQKSQHLFRSVIVIFILASLLQLPGVRLAGAANPAPVLVFYTTLPETEALTALSTINAAAVLPMTNYNSIAVNEANTLVYYDQWENGYDSDIANPTNLYSASNLGGTQVWGNGLAIDGCAPNIRGVALTCTNANDALNAGDVIILNNTVNLITTYNVLDQFSVVAYNNNNGTNNWSGNWLETGDDGAAGTGDILITGNQLRFVAAEVNDSLDRGASLPTSDACATLSFALGKNNIGNRDGFRVQISADGTTYTTLEEYTNATAAGNKSYKISSYATANTRLRFQVGNQLEAGNYWSVDDAQIVWGCRRDTSTILFDARDKIGSSKMTSMTRAVWASGSGTLNAFAHEMYGLQWGTAYESPVGTNTANAGTMFEYSALSVMAASNNTTVQIDADANGSYESTVTLQEGGSTLVTGILQGARVQADKRIQVVLLTGDIGSNYASRDMNLLSTSDYGSNYWSPVGVNTGNGGNTPGPTRLYLYNPSTNGSIYITCVRRTTAPTTSIQGPVLARGTVYLDLVNFEAAHCFASNVSGTATTDKIFAIGTIDENGIGWDWSFTAYPDEFLTTEVLVGLGLGKDPNDTTNTQDGSPLWVTPACSLGSTYIYVDWNNNGTADLIDLNGDHDTADTVDGIAENTSNLGISVALLQSVALYNPTSDTAPYDQTGARIWSRTASGVGYGGTAGCKLAMAWGADPRVASYAAPGLDVGTSVPPLFTPTAVEMRSFTAHGTNSSIELSWVSANEIDIIGYNLYRATTPAGARSLVYQTHANQSGSMIGDEYGYSDLDVQPGVTYTYWLEVLQIDGLVETVEPVSANLALAGNKIYLPLLSR